MNDEPSEDKITPCCGPGEACTAAACSCAPSKSRRRALATPCCGQCGWPCGYTVYPHSDERNHLPARSDEMSQDGERPVDCDCGHRICPGVNTGSCPLPARSNHGRTAVELTDDERQSLDRFYFTGGWDPESLYATVERIAARLRSDDGEVQR